MKKILSFAVLPLILAACGPSTQQPTGDGFTGESLGGASYTDTSYLMAAAPKYYIGTQYKVEDTMYTPAEDMTFNQTGIAGIIPAELNGAQTTNGEIFNVNQMLATSKTLPLPTIARVTNLDNGQSVVVRVNNRGPFVNSRLTDLSPAAAAKIGLVGQGKVQMQVMPDESAAVKAATLGNTVVSGAETGPVVTAPVATSTGSGPYTVQVAAFYSESSANALASRLSKYGNARVINEGGMYKVRIVDLDAPGARKTIDTLRANENVAPGLLKDGRWINADSI